MMSVCVCVAKLMFKYLRDTHTDIDTDTHTRIDDHMDGLP